MVPVYPSGDSSYPGGWRTGTGTDVSPAGPAEGRHLPASLQQDTGHSPQHQRLQNPAVWAGLRKSETFHRQA